MLLLSYRSAAKETYIFPKRSVETKTELKAEQISDLNL